MYKCEICGKEFSSLGRHLRSHKITMEDYKKKYGNYNAPDKDPNLIECPICGKYNFNNLKSHVKKIHNLTSEEFDKLYPGYICFTEEYHKQCSDACKKSLESQLSNPEKWSETRKKAAKTYDENHPGLRSRSAKIAHANVKEQLKEWWSDPEYRKKMSDKCKKQHENGLTEIVVRSANNGTRKYLFNGSICTKMRSSWEVSLAMKMDELGIEFKYEPFSIKYDMDGETRKYYPDFYINKLNLILEVKPEHEYELTINECKRKACINLGYNYEFCSISDIKNFKIFWENVLERNKSDACF